MPVPLSAETAVAAIAAAHPAADGLVWLDSGIGASIGQSLIAIGHRVALDPGAAVLPRLRAVLAELAGATSGAPCAETAVEWATELPAESTPESPAVSALESLPLGLVGWFGYELRAETMGMPAPVVPDAHRAAWLRVDRGLTIDHASGEAHLIALAPAHHGATDVAQGGASAPSRDVSDDGWIGELAEWRDAMLAVLAGAGASASASPASRSEPVAPPVVTWRDTDEHYAELVRRCQAAIRDGEAYQLCLTTQATLETADGSAHDALELYGRLRRSSPAHHGALLRIGGTTLLSASPETFLRVADGVVQTRPIKGTRPRDADPARDAELARELAADDKERAENLMIVDLMRNDLTRVCALGTVTVTGLLEVESYAHVHQLVSTIEGTLRPGLDALDAVAAALPAGSMTGAPKRRAIELLAEWEAGSRGIYSGAFGYLGVDGSADLAMVIRSIVIEGSRASIGAGGGVTALSVPAAEVAEMRLKAAALLRALGVVDAPSTPPAPSASR